MTDVKITQADGTMIVYGNVEAELNPTPPTPPPRVKLLKITDSPYDVTENTDPADAFTAIQQCYKDARAQGAHVEIPAGKFRYLGTLTHDGITVFCNGELQGAEDDSGYCMKGANPRLIGGILSHEGNTVRGTQIYHHGLALYDQTGSFELWDVHIKNPAAAGICVWDARNGRIVGCTVEDSLADGMHHCSSGDGVSGNIYERGNTVLRAGDDCLSFVTYMVNENVVHDIEVYNFRGEDNTWGRGIALVGADNIVIRGAALNRIKCFGLYTGIESAYGTVSRGQFYDVKVDECGANPDTPDGVLISGWTSTTVCELHDVVISKPKRHGVLRYHSSGNEFIDDNTIYDAIPGQDVHNVGAAKGQFYEFPRRGGRFEGPRRQG